MSISQPSSAPQSSCESPARPETRAAAEPVTLHQPLSDDVSPYSRTEWWVEVAVYPTQGCDVSGESPTFHAAMNGAAVKVHESGGQIRGLPHKQRYDIAYAALQQGVLVPRYCFKKPSKRTRRSVSASDDDDAPPSRQPPKLTKKVLGQRIIELENDLRPENGGRGTCDDTLAAGTSCSPKCYDGFVSSGDTTCDEDGQMTATTCEPRDFEETPAQISARELKAKAQASRDEMLDGITDPKARKKAKILADAATAGVPVKKLRLPMTASSEDEACEDVIETMRIDSDLASCEADAMGRRRLAASFSVNPEEVSEAALQEAIDNLDAAGILAFTSDEDPIAVLEEVPGVEVSALSAFEADAEIRGFHFLANFEAFEKNQSSVIFVRNDGHSPFSRASRLFP
jgi:hypothetical protein